MVPKRKKPTGDPEQAVSTSPRVNKRNRRGNPQDTNHSKIGKRLVKCYKWLCQSDRDRTPGFEELLRKILNFLYEAEVLQAEGQVRFADEVAETLEACHGMCQVHQRYNDWSHGLSRWSTHQPVNQTYETRLVPYDRELPLPGNQKNIKPSLYTSLVPRPDEVAYPPFVLVTPNRDPNWDLYFRQPQGIFLQRYFTTFYYHAKLFWGRKPGEVIGWETVPLFKNPGNPRAINYAEIENTTYEDYMARKWEELPKRPPKNVSPSAAEFEHFAVLRGYRRAALERVLNEYETWDNNVISSPWRRVVHPEPAQNPKTILFKPHTLPRIYEMAQYGKKDRSAEQEPSPWIFWYNQWLQQIKYLSGWSRQTYTRRYWEDHKRIALPINYMGPFLVQDKCVYDEHWLKMGRYLVTLQKNLEKINITHRRWLTQKITEDIRKGERGDPVPDDVMPRSSIDVVPDTDEKFRLVDEVDVAWLNFLCHPSATKGLVGLSHGKPEDTLTILLDHRIQLLVNDPLHNPFWVKDFSSKGHHKSVWRAEQIALEDLVPMLNLGGRDFFEAEWNNGVKTEVQRAARLNKGIKGVEPPNTLYQFSLKEAVKHCTKLAKMGRISYKRPVEPKEIKDMWWSGNGNLYYYPDENWATAGGYVCSTTPGINPLTHDEVAKYIDPETNPARHPEERIRWRHESEKALKNFNEGLRDLYATEMMYRQRTRAEPVIQRSKDAYRMGFLEEISWKLGPRFPEGSVEDDRDAPSWDDLVDYRTVVTKDIGYSWRTINFLRMLAFRMGHTIKHCRDVAKQTSENSALGRKHLYSALAEWERGTNNTHQANRDKLIKDWLIPFKASKPNNIISKVDAKHKYIESDDKTAVFRVIRHGIINDIVKNRTMLYPGRNRRYTNAGKETSFDCYERENIWSWASEPIRKSHAAYRRPLYFDVRRWPLNRQRKEVQARIAKREDEDPTIQPVSAFYKYDLRVGPTALIPSHSDLVSNAIISLHDSDKERVARQLINRFSEQMVKMIDNAKDYDQHWQIQIVPPKTLVPVVEVEKLKLQPKSEFLPGRAIFPMGDSLRQQLKISHDIERMIHPPAPSNLSTKIMGTISGLFKPPPERLALLPDIDVNRAPTSNPLKRKVPSSFTNTLEMPNKMQALMISETNHPVSRPRRRGPVGPALPQAPEMNKPPQPSIAGTTFKPDVRLLEFSHPRPRPNLPAAPALALSPAPKPPAPKPPAPPGPLGGRTNPPNRPEQEVPDQGVAAVALETQNDGSIKVNVFPTMEPTVPRESTPLSLFPRVPRGDQVAPPTLDKTTDKDKKKPPNAFRRRNSAHQGRGPGPENAEASVGDLVPRSGRSENAPQQASDRAAEDPTQKGGEAQQTQEREAHWEDAKRRAKRRAAAGEFLKAFPHGWRIMPTPGEDLECGLYAVIESVGAQRPRELGGEVPALDELRRLVRRPDDPELRALVAALGLTNTGNLSADQVAAALLAWGRRREVHLRLAVYRAGGDGGAQQGGLPRGLGDGEADAPEGGPQLIFCPVPDPAPDQPSYTIWIHSNETEEASRKSRKREHQHGEVLSAADARALEPATNHFSGMEPIDSHEQVQS